MNNVNEAEIDIENSALGLREKFGKPVDIFSLKKKVREDYLELSAEHHKEISKIFKDREITRDECPVCDTSLSPEPVMVIHEGKYLECDNCKHVVIGNGMTIQETEDFYRKSESYSSTYTDIESANLRVEQVAKPKALWALEEFKKEFGRYPKKVLDVGAGGGHVVKAFRDLGIPCDGIEISNNSRKFAKDVFGIDMIDKDFNTITQDDFNGTLPELICFWGVLEHIQDPNLFLEKAGEILTGSEFGGIVASVPNFRSGSTSIQEIFPETALRHFSPESHIHMFSMESIKEAFENHGIKPFSDWFIGMDAYEYWTQLVTCKRVNYLKENSDEFLEKAEESIKKLGISSEAFQKVENLVELIVKTNGDEVKVTPEITQAIENLQQAFDKDRASDEIVLMGKIKK